MKLFELSYPLKPYTLTQTFGQNLSPIYAQLGMLGHNGWDIVGQDGQVARASHDGIVTFTGEDGSGGLGIVIRTTEPFWYAPLSQEVNYKTIYWHLKPNTFKVKPGDIVKAGDPIAQCDNTGLSSGSHLHFGLKPCKQGEADWQWENLEQSNGYKGAIDPKPYFNGFYGEDIQQVLSIYQKIILAYKAIIEILKVGRV